MDSLIAMDLSMKKPLLGKVKKKQTTQRNVPYNINLLPRIFSRENNNYDRYKTLTNAPITTMHMLPEQDILKCLPPNFSIQNVDKRNGFMRKFTPDGQVLLSFSQDQRSLEVYEYRSIGAMADLLEGMTDEYITSADRSYRSLRIRQQAFERLFVLRTSIRMRYGISGGYLNREFSLFISPEESRYVLIASMGLAHNMPDVEDPYNYPDLHHDADHFFYNFYLIDLMVDYIADFVTYKYDSIQLSHNHGVSCVDAILSKYRQCIDIYEIDDACLKKLYEIGVWGAHMKEPCDLLAPYESFRPQAPRPLSHFKQRIITFLYRQVLREENLEVQHEKIKEFYRHFCRYERMVIVKMQLVTKGTVLMRYEQHPLDQSGSEDELEKEPLKLYVFYRIKSEKILNVFEGTSDELLLILRDYIDSFRNVRSYQTGRKPPSSENSVYLQHAFNETVEILNNPTLRLNPTLPVSTQSFSASPYLDYNRYIYDDHQISSLERPRISSMDTIVFRDRINENALFRLILEPDEQYYFDPANDRYGLARRELIAFIFHPYEPFIISVQKLSQRYVVNFHMYNKWTIVSQTEE